MDQIMRMRGSAVSFGFICFIFIFLIGCAHGMKPVPSGQLTEMPYPGTRAIVWGSHTGATGQAVTMLQKFGLRIVERSRLQQVFDEQKLRMSNTSADEGHLMKIGKIVGAETIVFVDVQMGSDVVSQSSTQMRGLRFASGSKTETMYNTNVAVRAVNIESGEVLWSGSAHYPRKINNPEAGIVHLTTAAIHRAMCPDRLWSNFSGCNWAKLAGTGTVGARFGRQKTADGAKVVVTEIIPGLPAEAAGMTVGDELISCNGKKGFQSYIKLMASCKSDAQKPITYELRRKGEPLKMKIVPISREEAKETIEAAAE